MGRGPYTDIQHENPRCVGKGRLLILSGSTGITEAAIEIAKADVGP